MGHHAWQAHGQMFRSQRSTLISWPCWPPQNCSDKIQCVGHVKKRLETALENLKKSHKRLKKPKKLNCGKGVKSVGRLTNKVIHNLQNLYRRIIHSNKDKWEGMQNALRQLSTIKYKQISSLSITCVLMVKIPEGSEYSNKHSISDNVMKAKPICERLSYDELLIQCLDSITQNANPGNMELLTPLLNQNIYELAALYAIIQVQKYLSCLTSVTEILPNFLSLQNQRVSKAS
ncbi:uncharacterized protein LOC143234888 [Tachypleus tridentatus]|uniref:uncharacterized protein LOC143234888 n=1 Tax=Tachypleus tridentatus TaxID=6853 RepID=UPI003FD0B726